MLVLGMVLVWAGYGVGSWGWLLVKGENITLREWFSPLHPFTGPLDSNGKVPQGSIFPTGKKGGSANTPASGASGSSQPSGQGASAAQRAEIGAAQLGQGIGGFLGNIAP